jgi:SAM-dependent methyltransferase
MKSKTSHHCLLCESSRIDIADSVSGTELRSLWKCLGSDLDDAAYGPITRDAEVNLYRCLDCGFQFYEPDFAGSGEFYEALMATRPYPLGSPEFPYAIDFAIKHGIRSVLDVGGGEGAFLDLAKKAGLATAGVELNRHAADMCTAKGHRMFSKPMEDITLAELDGGAELLTLFQVVEHVRSPVDFVAAAARLVRPGGHLMIAVPSEERMLGLLHHDPANWPPHHVSRWRGEDLEQLAKRTGLVVVDQSADPLYGRAIPWAADLHRRLEDTLGRKSRPFTGITAQVASVAYRGLRLQNHLGLHGLSLRTVMRKPSE